MRLALQRTGSCLLVLACLVLGAGPALAGPAGAADGVREAEQRVAAVRAEVARSASQLSSGVQRLDRSQAELERVRERLDVARLDAAGASASATAAQDRLQRVVAAAYRSPVPASFLLVLSGPERFRAALVVRADLEQVHGRQGDLLREATSERRRADDAVAQVERLGRDSARRTRELAAQAAALSRAARAAQARLRTASDGLAAARSAQRASRLRAVGVAGTCRARMPDVVANGFLPGQALCPLEGAPGHALRADAAAAFARLDAASVAERGTGLCVTDSYRSYAQQVDVFARKPQLAAVPGTSRHGYGVALDLGCGVERFGTEAHRWMQRVGPRYGWVHPAWAGPSGSMPEPWHWEHTG